MKLDSEDGPWMKFYGFYGEHVDVPASHVSFTESSQSGCEFSGILRKFQQNPGTYRRYQDTSMI